ncbi:MAG: hypothetical protein ACFFC7_18695 [Candidatus Hermodarchaeota archaeon]
MDNHLGLWRGNGRLTSQAEEQTAMTFQTTDSVVKQAFTYDPRTRLNTRNPL